MFRHTTSRLTSAISCAKLIFVLSGTYLVAIPVTAALIVIPSPSSVLPGEIQSQTDAVLFQESVSTLASPLSVDIAGQGLYTDAAPNASGIIRPLPKLQAT
jgi:hypothetical protein